jgi:hypothetical protein
MYTAREHELNIIEDMRIFYLVASVYRSNLSSFFFVILFLPVIGQERDHAYAYIQIDDIKCSLRRQLKYL